MSDLWGIIANRNLSESDPDATQLQKNHVEDSSTVIEMVIDRLGPFLMSIKDKFDSYAAKSADKQILSRQQCLGQILKKSSLIFHRRISHISFSSSDAIFGC